MLRLILGLLQPSEGHLEIDTTRVTSENIRSLRKRMGYVLQHGGLFPHLTAEENVLLMARHLGSPETENQARLHELADLTHLPHASLKRYPAELSGGQRQRLGLMRALMLDPDVLLLDEPLGALDPLVRAALQSDLRDIFQGLAKTVIIVTHDLGEAAYLGDLIVLMRAGKIEQTGSMEDLVETPASDFVREFLRAQRSLHI